MSFAELFRKHLTAKPSAYGEVYDSLPPPDRVLEVGVKAGGSLLAWAERWPDAEVYGVDISMALVRPEVLEHPRIQLDECDATKYVPDLPMMDLIVDDGSHALADQRRVLDYYSPALRPGGTYVVEDVTTDEGVAELTEDAACLGFRQTRVLHPPGLEFRVVTFRKPA